MLQFCNFSSFFSLFTFLDYINEKSVFDDEDDSQYMKPDPVIQFHNPEYFDGPPQSKHNAQILYKPRSDYYNDLQKDGQELKPLMIQEDHMDSAI